jgi:hypothetical protein
MTTTTKTSERKASSKLDVIRNMLARKNGATLAELMTATGWQRHSVHGQLAALRKKGSTIERTERRGGASAYFLKA